MPLKNTLLITATDTDAGKTVVTTALAAYFQEFYPQKSLAIMKLVQTGEGDRSHYAQLFNLDQLSTELNPLHYQLPLAPPIAADRENRSIDLELAWKTLSNLSTRRDLVLIEGIGGLGTPVTHELTIGDLAKLWRLPTILVVRVKLGAIGQAIANVGYGRYLGLNLKGIILSCADPDSNVADFAPPELIQSLTYLPVFGTIPYLTDPTDLGQLSKIIFNLELGLIDKFIC